LAKEKKKETSAVKQYLRPLLRVGGGIIRVFYTSMKCACMPKFHAVSDREFETQTVTDCYASFMNLFDSVVRPNRSGG